MKQERFDEPGLVALAAWITCDFSLMTKIDDFAESASSSSDEEVASDDEVVESESSSELESDTGSFVGVLGAGLVLFKSAFGGSICNGCKPADGCLAPRACDASGLQPALMSTRRSRWRKRLGQTSSRE